MSRDRARLTNEVGKLETENKAFIKQYDEIRKQEQEHKHELENMVKVLSGKESELIEAKHRRDVRIAELENAKELLLTRYVNLCASFYFLR